MASYIPNLYRDNISLYTVPAAAVLCVAPRFFAANTYKAATSKKFDSMQPRSFSETVKGDQSLDAKTKGRIVRAEAAVLNGFETLGLYAAAVTAANAAGVGAGTLNGLSLAYLTIRLTYNHIYIYQDLLPTQVRSFSWMASLGVIFSMFILAGNRFKNAVVL